jgi:hypothetical protein
MKGQKNTRRFGRLFRSPLTMALMCCAGISAATTAASAQYIDLSEPVTRPAEELMIGQTAYTQPAGTTQLILSGSQARTGESRNSSISARAEVGITDRLQVHGELPIDITDRSSSFSAQTGVSRAEVGAKYAITEYGAPVALSAGMGVEVPFASSDVTGDRPDAGPSYKPSLMIASGSGPVTFHADAEAELGQSSQALNYNVGTQYSLGSWVPSVEVNARAMENTSPEVYATPGLTYKFSDRAQLGAGAAIGLNDRSESVQMMAKFSMQLGQ